MKRAEERSIVVDEEHTVSALLVRPAEAWAMYVLAHGAGAGMTHAFLETTAKLLASAGIATLRYQFPYTEAGGRRPDSPVLLEATVRAAAAHGVAEGLPTFAGGKSMGGRMTSQAQAAEALPDIRGLVFLGFPLHAPKRDTVSRATHLDRVTVPMLFVQGTRDELANIDLMNGVCTSLGSRATLHVVDGGDHSFKVLKRTGRSEEDVMRDIVETMTAFMRNIVKKDTPDAKDAPDKKDTPEKKDAPA
jgi:predicted alpha/beta-hydrolase family hydrolase